MGITPLDIKKKTFTSQMRGISKTEVREFLETVAAEMEELRKERAQLADKVEEFNARLEGYQRTEQLLKDTLVTAQKATGELRDEAKKEAELIVEKARVDAERTRLEAEQRLKSLSDDIRALETKRANLNDEIAGVARTYLAMAERMNNRKPSAEAADSAERPGDKV